MKTDAKNAINIDQIPGQNGLLISETFFGSELIFSCYWRLITHSNMWVSTNNLIPEKFLTAYILIPILLRLSINGVLIHHFLSELNQCCFLEIVNNSIPENNH